ncbi:hypothetical protein CTA2_5348 [Colletotrichum tanaceti]|nr:hypothetical protein CTA2_5348 [Colletotrichum tanaceti]
MAVAGVGEVALNAHTNQRLVMSHAKQYPVTKPAPTHYCVEISLAPQGGGRPEAVEDDGNGEDVADEREVIAEVDGEYKDKKTRQIMMVSFLLLESDIAERVNDWNIKFKGSPRLPFGTAVSGRIQRASLCAGSSGATSTSSRQTDHNLNKPRALRSWTAEALAVLSHYYVMRADLSMRGNVELDMASSDEPAAAGPGGSGGETALLSDADAQVTRCKRTRSRVRPLGPPLSWYRVLVDAALSADLACFRGHTRLAVPTKYVSGTSDWGAHQVPGPLECDGGRRERQGDIGAGEIHLESTWHDTGRHDTTRHK